ncbi:Growth arrest-specific protein 1 [Merluccius polli]|uniref:Growth arrest-specific protein 1 n=1 Tax=Merluccius polli TaxID=89951 RepID=A0AA47LZ29_MERPO|nr:Growth arrest-specific protein 1 [Merluccius polli]
MWDHSPQDGSRTQSPTVEANHDLFRPDALIRPEENPEPEEPELEEPEPRSTSMVRWSGALALLRCHDEPACDAAYGQYLAACEGTLRGPRRPCPGHCVGALLRLNQTRGGPDLGTCDCARDAVCLRAQRAVGPCLPRDTGGPAGGPRLHRGAPPLRGGPRLPRLPGGLPGLLRPAVQRQEVLLLLPRRHPPDAPPAGRRAAGPLRVRRRGEAVLRGREGQHEPAVRRGGPGGWRTRPTWTRCTRDEDYEDREEDADPQSGSWRPCVYLPLLYGPLRGCWSEGHRGAADVSAGMEATVTSDMLLRQMKELITSIGQ